MTSRLGALLLASLFCFACTTSQAPLDEPLWLDVQLGTPLDDEARGVTIDPQGSIFLTGYDNGQNGVIDDGPVGDAHAFVMRFGRDGALVWRRDLETAAADLGERIARSPSDGHLFVAGSTSGAFADATNQGSFDLFVSELDPDSNVVRTVQLGRPVGEHVAGLALSAEGVFLSAQDEVKIEGRAVTAWQDASALVLDRPMATANGAPRWWRHQDSDAPDFAGGVAVEADGSAIYVAGSVGAGAARGPYLSRLSPTGEVVWSTRISPIGLDLATAIAIAPDGQLYVAGATLGRVGPQIVGEQDAFVVRLDRATGEVTWSAQVGSTGSDLPWALAFANDGTIVVAGETLGVIDPAHAYSGSGDAFALAIDRTTGEVVHAWQGATEGDDVARAIAVDAKGHAYVTGYTEGSLVAGATPRGRRDLFLVRAW